MKVKMAHIGIVVKSLEDSRKFYEDVMGFKTHHDAEFPGELMNRVFGIDSPAKVAFLNCDSGAIEIFMFDNNPQDTHVPGKCGINHFAIEVENVEDYVNSLKIKGAKLNPIKKGDRTIWFASDPDGNIIELKEIKK